MHKIILILVIIINSLASAQNYGNWYEIDSMNIARVGHAMVVLPNGDVLVSGNDADSIQSSAEIYEFSTGKWRYTTPMNVPRTLHNLVLLNTGKVLAIGGLMERSCELFDPQTETWTMTDSIPTFRYGGETVTELADGRIMVAGGHYFDTTSLNYFNLNKVDIYNPITESWSQASSMHLERNNHRATLLSDGRVLVTGGVSDSLSTCPSEIYNPITNSWELTGNLQEKRSAHAAILLKNGNVFVSGGSSNTCEIFDTTINQWVFVDNMLMPRTYHKIYYLNKADKLLIVGSGMLNSSQESWEIYDPNLLKPDYVEAFPIKLELRFNNIQLNNENIFVAGGWEYLFTPMPVFYPSKRCWIFDITTDVNEKKLLLTNYKLSQNYPNPFNSQTKISWQTPVDGHQTLKVYDILGREVATLVDEYRQAGVYEVEFSTGTFGDAADLPSGVYIYKLQSAGYSAVKKMILSK
ncbi:MAG: T9SS type A sorting domain-containing protein [Ignavibacterium sp.]|uniref:T9SS type A sorting domain-containing protein n=1 Tax=Ignavibacterium sp. TaxID=2651167 RepID=UPI004049E41A